MIHEGPRRKTKGHEEKLPSRILVPLSDLGAIFEFSRGTGLRGLALSALCCRRLRGSGVESPFPWAYAHGYLLPPLRGSMGRPGVRPEIINC